MLKLKTKIETLCCWTVYEKCMILDTFGLEKKWKPFFSQISFVNRNLTFFLEMWQIWRWFWAGLYPGSIPFDYGSEGPGFKSRQVGEIFVTWNRLCSPSSEWVPSLLGKVTSDRLVSYPGGGSPLFRLHYRNRGLAPALWALVASASISVCCTILPCQGRKSFFFSSLHFLFCNKNQFNCTIISCLHLINIAVEILFSNEFGYCLFKLKKL